MTIQSNGHGMLKFEEWAEGQRCSLDKWVRGHKAGQYKNPVVAEMWKAWQAALNSVDGKDDDRGDNYRK